jgi:hypothetical protein
MLSEPALRLPGGVGMQGDTGHHPSAPRDLLDHPGHLRVEVFRTGSIHGLVVKARRASLTGWALRRGACRWKVFDAHEGSQAESPAGCGTVSLTRLQSARGICEPNRSR